MGGKWKFRLSVDGKNEERKKKLLKDAKANAIALTNDTVASSEELNQQIVKSLLPCQWMIKTHSHVLRSQVQVRKTLCVIYTKQLLVIFSHL